MHARGPAMQWKEVCTATTIKGGKTKGNRAAINLGTFGHDNQLVTDQTGHGYTATVTNTIVREASQSP